MKVLAETQEAQRLKEANQHTKHWRRWGPFLSERQWATVREDYSEDGDAWRFLTHDMSRSYAYRWGEDGLGGWCDNHQRICFAYALWNHQDAILKERLFGVTNHQGNHGEDVKEAYYYLDALPSFSWMKMQYKYPMTAFPYAKLVDENERRSRIEREFELLETGVFDENRYWDVDISYAKESSESMICSIKVTNQSESSASLDVIPMLWLRNTWTPLGKSPEAQMKQVGHNSVQVEHHSLPCHLYYSTESNENVQFNGILFTDNETNTPLLYGSNTIGTRLFYKDAFHERIVYGNESAVRSDQKGTKVGLWYTLTVPSNSTVTLHCYLTETKQVPDFSRFDAIIQQRQAEAEEYYNALLPTHSLCPSLTVTHRQALAGVLWSLQYYFFDVHTWFHGDPDSKHPPPPPTRHLRNKEWLHMYCEDVLSMPDKWEYPFFAAWDLAFHCIPLGMVDMHMAKKQLLILTREWYLHPNGQIPAYEWQFSDVNPPVHAWAALRLFHMERHLWQSEDRLFLERVFHKLLLNFTWWVNRYDYSLALSSFCRKDQDGLNVFEGGFLGLDNIGVFNRSEPLPNGGKLRQADGTSWVAMFSLCMLDMALTLTPERPAYEDIASKFFEHFLYISDALTFENHAHQQTSLWDEHDGFYYDALVYPNGQQAELLRVRSLVGLTPLFACLVLEPEVLERLPAFERRLQWFLKHRPVLTTRNVASMTLQGVGRRRLLALVDRNRLIRILIRMLDEQEFLSPFGIRSLSKYHEQYPFIYNESYSVHYEPAESSSGMFGGNSNWRGAVWFPMNFLLIEALRRFHHYYGNDLLVECPTHSGTKMNLLQVADEIQKRLCRLFEPDKETGFAALHGTQVKEALHSNPLFYEYFDADSGRGLGASHQTGWTALIAKIIQYRSQAGHEIFKTV